MGNAAVGDDICSRLAWSAQHRGLESWLDSLTAWLQCFFQCVSKEFVANSYSCMYAVEVVCAVWLPVPEMKYLSISPIFLL